MAEEKRKNRPTVNPDEFPCPICGKTDYEWGVSVGEGPSQRLYARANVAGWGEGEVLYTRKCLHCSNVLFFTTKP